MVKRCHKCGEELKRDSTRCHACNSTVAPDFSKMWKWVLLFMIFGATVMWLLIRWGQNQ